MILARWRSQPMRERMRGRQPVVARLRSISSKPRLRPSSDLKLAYLFRLSNVSSVPRNHVARYNVISWLSLLFLASLFLYSATFVFFTKHLSF